MKWALAVLLTVFAIPATLFALVYAQLMIAGDCVALHGAQLSQCEHKQSVWMAVAFIVCTVLYLLALKLIFRKKSA